MHLFSKSGQFQLLFSAKYKDLLGLNFVSFISTFYEIDAKLSPLSKWVHSLFKTHNIDLSLGEST